MAIYGSGSSVSANYSQNKAKVNYAQVEEQTGFHVGKGGMDVKVAGNTHLAGSVIDSEADQDKNLSLIHIWLLLCKRSYYAISNTNVI